MQSSSNRFEYVTEKQKKKKDKEKEQTGTCPKIPPRMAQTGGNSLVLVTNLFKRESGI